MAKNGQIELQVGRSTTDANKHKLSFTDQYFRSRSAVTKRHNKMNDRRSPQSQPNTIDTASAPGSTQIVYVQNPNIHQPNEPNTNVTSTTNNSNNTTTDQNSNKQIEISTCYGRSYFGCCCWTMLMIICLFPGLHFVWGLFKILSFCCKGKRETQIGCCKLLFLIITFGYYNMFEEFGCCVNSFDDCFREKETNEEKRTNENQKTNCGVSEFISCECCIKWSFCFAFKMFLGFIPGMSLWWGLNEVLYVCCCEGNKGRKKGCIKLLCIMVTVGYADVCADFDFCECCDVIKDSKAADMAGDMTDKMGKDTIDNIKSGSKNIASHQGEEMQDKVIDRVAGYKGQQIQLAIQKQTTSAQATQIAKELCGKQQKCVVGMMFVEFVAMVIISLIAFGE